jgi:hypothetical protein
MTTFRTIALTILVAVPALQPQTAAAADGVGMVAPADVTRTGVVDTVRKSLTYVRLVNRAGARRDDYALAEQTVRRNVEQGRFDINELPPGAAALDVPALARMTRDYLDAVKLERAADRADFDARTKSLDITAEDLARVAASGFLYAPVLRRLAVDRQVMVVPQGGRMVRVETWVAEAVVEVVFWRLNFGDGTAQEAYRIVATGSSSGVFAGGATRGDAVRGALADLGESLKTQVRNLADFRLQVNVERAGWNGVWFPLTARDGLVLDSLLRAEELTTDGATRRVAWLAVRDVGDGKTESQSYAQVINTRDGWSLTGGEMLFEVAQRGIGLQIGPVHAAVAVSDPSGNAAAADRLWGGRLLATKRLAEATGISELFAELALAGGVAGDAIELGAAIGIAKRFSFHRFFVGLGVHAGPLRVQAPGPWGYGGAWSVGVDGELTLSAWLTPGFALEAWGGGRAYLPVEALYDSDDVLVSDPGFHYRPTGWLLGAGPVFRF